MKRIWVPQTIVTVMLFWALNPDNPYSYYIQLRWVCFGIFAYLAYRVWQNENEGWVWVLGMTAAVYNPIIPVHLTREIWPVINVVTIGIGVASIVTLKFKIN